jgi:phosphoribosylanthranilate isomerase
VRTRVKVCGVTRPEDAAAAVAAGADAIGLNFVAESPRRVSLERARAIVAEIPPFVLRVGVFANPSAPDVARLAEALNLDAAQLHGEESPEEAARIPIPWYKAHRVDERFDPATIAAYGRPMALLDAAGAARGGTGRTFDWAVAHRCPASVKIILAGGLTPENAGAAIRAASPWALDVNSGVESAPGLKDAALLERFFAAVAAEGR